MRASARPEVSPTPSIIYRNLVVRCVEKNPVALPCGGLEPLVAVAPEFRPGRSLFSLASGFRLLPFRGTFLLAVACCELAGAWLFFRFGSLLGCARLLREGGGIGVRQRNCDQSGSKQGGKHNFVHDVTSP